jgi:hypothetical protein
MNLDKVTDSHVKLNILGNMTDSHVIYNILGNMTDGHVKLMFLMIRKKKLSNGLQKLSFDYDEDATKD